VDIERVNDELKHSNSKLRTTLRLDPARVREVAARVAAEVTVTTGVEGRGTVDASPRGGIITP